jgi:hypothetical protein
VATGAVGALAAGLVVQGWAVAGSIGTGRSFAQVERYSAELSDLVTRAIGDGVEELVFVGWLVPALALAGLWSVRRQRGLALLLGSATLVPILLALGANLPGYELLWRVLPGLHATRVPERLLPIAWVAIAALVALAVEALHDLVSMLHKASPARRDERSWVIGLATAGLVLVLARDLHVPGFGAVAADTPSGSYRAIDDPGRLLELPVIRPDVHYGSVFLGYARQSPRERPQGYSTLAPPAADRWARSHRGLSCGRGVVPTGIDWVVVHRGVYAQSGFFAADCPARAGAMLARTGWQRIARDGALTTWRRGTG